MGAPSPLDIWRIILQQRWLLGALLAVSAAALNGIGLVLQKKAQYELMGGKVDTSQQRHPAPTIKQLMTKKRWWLGLVCFLAYSPIMTGALMYAPESTVTPLHSCQVILNFFLCFGFLYERFKRKDIVATLVCVIGTVVMNSVTPTWMKGAPGGHLVDFPVEKALDFTLNTWGNVGFMAYLCVWAVLLVICLYVIAFVSVTNVEKPFAIPLLIGLLLSQVHFLSKISWTLVEEGRHEPLSWWTKQNNAALITVCVTVTLYWLSVYANISGLRLLSCRFFVPATVVAVEVLTVTQLLLFFRTYEGMTYTDIMVFIASSIVSVLGLFGIDPEQTRIPSPQHAELNSPLLKEKVGVVAAHQSVLAIIDEYKVRKPEPRTQGELKTVSMSGRQVTCSDKMWRFFPIIICVVMVSVPLSLIYFGKVYAAFVFLTIFGLYQGWRLGVHIALFSYVGIKKMGHFENADFKALYEAEAKAGNQPSGHSGPKWKDVIHFVVLPNYKEDIGVLKLAIQSIKKSSVAKEQIGIVLAMEEREKESATEMGSVKKAAELQRVFKDDFRYVWATFHPKIEGEPPGKSANTKWAAEKLFTEFMPGANIDDRNVIVTVADADSEFHPEYYAALSYYFCHAGGQDGDVPDRYTTIWQAPILHFKNYIEQPSLVRLASFITSQHELANLADPNATRVPYSTYSISAVLAKKVEGWDPNWISEDWHMALKCFFATGGGLKISPIFLPVLNYAPDGETWVQTLAARWTQAKRHALGFSEMVYFGSNFGRVWKAIDTPWRKSVYKWRAGFLWLKLLMIHLVMAIFFVTAPVNGYLISYFARNPDLQRLDANTWTFLINCVFQSAALLSFFSIFLISVLVYEAVKPRVDNATIMKDGEPVNNPKLSIMWRSKPLHLLSVLIQSAIWLPFFFAAAGLAEWIAAVKTTKGNEFDYEVASKPVIEGEKVGDASA